jgi:hypothetical protein
VWVRTGAAVSLATRANTVRWLSVTRPVSTEGPAVSLANAHVRPDMTGTRANEVGVFNQLIN